MIISVSEIIKDSYLVCKNNWRNIFTYVLLLFLPSLILSFLGIVGIYLSNYSEAFTLTTNITILAVFAAGLIFSAWATIALTKEIFNLLMGKSLKWKINFSDSSYLIWPFVYTSVLVTLIILGGSLLLIIPGLIFAGWYLFAVTIVIVEEKRGLGSLRASKNLVVGRWFPVVLRVLIPAILYSVATFVIQYAILVPLNYLIQSPKAIIIINPIINSFVTTAFAPFAIAASLILYLSLKANPQDKI